MQSRMLRRLTAAAVLGLAVGLSVVSTAEARPSRPSPRVTRGGFNLFAGATNVLVNVNRVQCNITNFGNQCVDPNGSPVVGGGFWPKGSPDQYIFNGGLQLGAIVCYDVPNCSTPGTWKGDTVGVFFMDPRGDQRQGDVITNIYNSLNSDDVANWPADAVIADTSLYAASLIGRTTISQQDTWVRYWDGNTNLTTGRKHTMGVLVEQRGLAWNFPTGNEDIVYFLFRFVNITSGNRSDYDNLTNAGYTPTQVDAIFAIAQDFRARAQSAYNVTLPAGGFTFHNAFIGYFQDADEGNAGFNYSVATLPFAETNVIKSDFSEPNWAFPPNIYATPFAPAPGFEGVKYLKSPINPATGRPFGISVWSNTCNGCGVLNDAVGVSQMYRYLSGTPSPALGDASCTVNPATTHTCGAIQVPADTRFFMASGPVDMAPGTSSVIVVAMVHAAPVASMAATGSGIYALPAFSLAPYITPGVGTLTPGIPATPESLAIVGGSRVRPIERAEGWASFSDVNGDGIIEQNEVNTTPRSLLDKDKVAQAVFDNKFLLPFAPEAPIFFLVPGDKQVTIAWQKSVSETIGDPYFNVASKPLNADLTANALYDPNYRKFDVEGYRIWRGRTQAEMQVVAQFDYAGTQLNDYTGAVVTSSFGNQCAPELGVTASCPVAFQFPYNGSAVFDPVPLVGDVVQIPSGGRTQLANGNILILQADTAITGGGTGFPALTDNQVPFVYVDNSVRNGFQYFYAVTAFDVNSVKSGPSSLESPLVTKTATPRVPSGAETPGTFSLTYTGRGTNLDPNASEPTLDAATGIFSGPQPPTNGAAIGFAAFLPYVASGTVGFSIDSIVPSEDCVPLGDNCVTGTYWITAINPGASTKAAVPFVMEGTTGPSAELVYQFKPIRMSQSLASRFGGDSTFTLTAQATMDLPGAWNMTSKGRGAANNEPPGAGRFNGPRWWAGSANEALTNPNGNVCASLSSGGCVDTVGNGNASAAGIQGGHINGVLPGIQYLWSPEGYMTATNPLRDMEIATSSVQRAADFKVYWNGTTAGKVDSVIDVTHNVVVPFSPVIRASWGILNDSGFTNTPAASTLDGNINFLTFTDIMCVDPIPTYIGSCGGLPRATAAFLMNHAIANPMNFKASSTSATGGAALVAQGATGNGFIFYLNGSFFVMQLQTTLAACCQGTVWNARFYAGNITGSPGSFGFTPSVRPPAVPGLNVVINYSGSSFNTAVSSDSLMRNIHTVPDPYYVTNALEITANTKVLRFVNLPAKAIIRIYSASGILVNVLAHNDPGAGGEQVWNLRNRNNQFVASGVYFYHVEAPDGKTKIGRFTVVNFAQ